MSVATGGGHTRRQVLLSAAGAGFTVALGGLAAPLRASAAVAMQDAERRRAYGALIAGLRDASRPGVRAGLGHRPPAAPETLFEGSPSRARSVLRSAADALDEAAAPARFVDLASDERVRLVREHLAAPLQSGRPDDIGARLYSLLVAALQPVFPDFRPEVLPSLI